METPSVSLGSLGSIVQWIDESINHVLLEKVAQNVTGITEAIWLPLELGVTIYLMFYGYLIATQQVPTPFGAALWKIVKIVMVVAIIEANGFYQTQIMETMLRLPDDMMSIVTGMPGSMTEALSEFHNAGIEISTRIEERAPDGFTELAQTVLFSLVALIIVVVYTLVTIIGLLLMTVAKVGMAVVVMLGPIFIGTLLFDQTKRHFSLWLEQALYFAVFGMAFISVFSLVMGMLGYLQAVLLRMTTADSINILQIMAVVILISMNAIFLMKLPTAIVAKITGGNPIDLPFIR